MSDDTPIYTQLAHEHPDAAAALEADALDDDAKFAEWLRGAWT